MTDGQSPREIARIGGLAYPADEARALLVLAHGAGAGQQHPFMAGMATALAARGVSVVTFDFPYMRERRKIPDRAPVLEAAFLDAVVAARAWRPDLALCIGGKSMGGRMATHLGASGLDHLRGIVVFGYPLHPPGKPDQARVAHLPSITTPLLIVQGARDTFGTPAELAPALETMRAPVTLHVVEGGDHSLAVRGKTREHILDDVATVVAVWIHAR